MSHIIIPIFLQLIIITMFLVLPNTNTFSIEMIPIESPHLQIVPDHFTIHEQLQFLANISMTRVQNFRKDLLTPDSVSSKLYALSSRFVTQIGLGEDAGFNQPFLALDTGSDLIWVLCEGCNPCFDLSRAEKFKFRLSPSFQRLRLDDNLCLSPKFDFVGTCGFNMIYDIQEPHPLIKGGVAKDTFHLFNPDTGNLDSYSNVAFGCALMIESFSFGTNNNIAGIFGMSPGPRSFLTQLDAQTKGRFSYCLPPFTYPLLAKSTLYFGDAAQIYGDATSQVQTISMHVSNAYHLYVNGISVDGKRLSIDPSVFERQGYSKGFFIDSGAPITVLTRSAYDPLKTAVVAYFKEHYDWQPGPPVDGMDLCYGPYPNHELKPFPPVIFHFRNNAHVGEIDMVLNKGNMFLKLGNQGFCMTVKPVQDPGPCLFGAFQQINFNILFDVHNSLLSFVPQYCRENVP